MDKDYTSAIKEIIESKYLTSFQFEPLNDLETWGFVVGCNEIFTLIHYFNRNFYELDGYSVFFNENVSEYWVYTPDEDYLESKYVNVKDIKPKFIPEINLNSLPELLLSASQNFPLVTIYRDKLAEKNSIVGKVTAVKEKTFEFLAIRTDAKWKEVSSRIRLADVTRIDFGDRYQEVLTTVADYEK
jgi:hypothetical protein